MKQQLIPEWRLKAMEDWQDLEPKDILTPDTCTCTCSVEFDIVHDCFKGKIHAQIINLAVQWFTVVLNI